MCLKMELHCIFYALQFLKLTKTHLQVKQIVWLILSIITKNHATTVHRYC